MIGQTLGNYRVLSELGRGGMGVVYVAEHQLLGRRAAIKVLLPDYAKDADLVSRFFNEARAAARVKHPGIVDVYDFGHDQDGAAFIAMELCEGESLAARLRRQRPSPAEAVPLLRQLASALGAAHTAGIVHRDIKPDNVFLVPEADAPGGVRVKVLDFGIAKLATEAAGSGPHTRTGSLLGTPLYMSPEQCRGGVAVDRRSDVYSVGCIMYEVFCGRVPFLRQGLGDIMGGHMYEEPAAPRSLAPGLPASFEAAVLRALRKKPEDRYPGMEALIEALDALAEGAAGAVAAPAARAEVGDGTAATLATMPADGKAATLAHAPVDGKAATLAHAPVDGKAATLAHAPVPALAAATPAPVASVPLPTAGPAQAAPRWPWIAGGAALVAAGVAALLPLMRESRSAPGHGASSRALPGVVDAGRPAIPIYIELGSLTDKTSTAGPFVDSFIEAEVDKDFAREPGFATQWDGGLPGGAAGFRLSPTLEQLDFRASGDVGCRLSVAVFTLPGRSMLADVRDNVTVKAVTSRSESAEACLAAALRVIIVKQVVPMLEKRAR